MPNRSSARIIVPGLLGPVADPDAAGRLLPRVPRLEYLLARAAHAGDAVADGEGAVCAAFGVEGPAWPVAPAARVGETAEPPRDGWWIRVDPVHLRVDTNHARLFGPHALGLARAEADAFAALINERLQAGDAAIEVCAPERWYLRLEAAPALHTHSLWEAAGRNVNPFLPHGDDAAAWRGWLTEIQMLLHDAAPNTEREASGRLPVNSLWPWGGGWMPRPARRPARVRADDPLSAGLARLAGVEHESLPASPATTDWPPGETLIVEPGVRDPLVHGEIEAWLEAVQQTDEGLIGPLLDALRAGHLGRLELETGDGRRFVMGRAGRWRVWRAVRPWHERMAAE